MIKSVASGPKIQMDLECENSCWLRCQLGGRGPIDFVCYDYRLMDA